MAMLRPLQNILRQNKKKRPNAYSFSPKIPGLGGHAPSYIPQSKPSSYNHDFYNNSTSKTYDLPLDTPAVRQTQYERYESQIAHHFIEMQEIVEPIHEIQNALKKDILASQGDHVEFIRNLKNDNIETSKGLLDVSDIWKEHTSGNSATDDIPAAPERVINIDTLFNEPESLPAPADVLDAFAQLKKTLPDDHPDVVNLRSQVNFIMDNPELFPQPEDFGIVRDFELDMSNPYLDDDLDQNADPFHEQNLMNTQQLEINEEILEHSLMSNESLFEGEDTQYTLDDMLSCETESFDGIEQIVQQDYSIVSPDPFMQQQMYEEDLLNQHFNNPYQMPGMSNPFGPAPGF